MNYKVNHLILVLLICSFTNSVVLAQSTFSGKLEGYINRKADIVTGLSQPIIIGTVNQQGEFSIPLNENFINQVKQSVAAENAENDEWKTSLMTLNRAFGNCNDGEVEIENGDQPVIKLSVFNSFGIMDLDKKKDYGYFLAVNSRDFAEALNNFDFGTDETGFMLDWYYFEAPAKVNGSCFVKTYTTTQKEEDIYQAKTTYELEFKAGWNLVKFAYEDLHVDSQGKKYVQHKSYTTLDKVPDDVNYIYFSE